MKDQLTPETRAAMVDYRLERAHAAIDEADYNAAAGYFNLAINRLYYACFYAASALLLSRHAQAGTHNGTKTQLSMYYVRTGRLSVEHGTTYSLLFEKCQSSDYCDFAYSDVLLVNTLRPRAQAFVDAVERLTREEQAADPEREQGTEA